MWNKVVITKEKGAPFMLYSTAVYFKTTENIHFSSDETEALHGLFFKLLSKVNEDLATQVHDDLNKQFTLSTFRPFLKRQGNKKILFKDTEYRFRITFLDETLFHAFLTYFLQADEPLRLNGVQIHPIKILTTDQSDPWCSETSFEELLHTGQGKKLVLKFHSTTSFRHGERQMIFPLPESVFGSLLYRWQQAGGPELSLEQDDFQKIDVSRYDLKTRREQFRNYALKGFTGECEYWLGQLSESKQQEIQALANFAFYSGVGYKTTMGLGQVEVRSSR